MRPDIDCGRRGCVEEVGCRWGKVMRGYQKHVSLSRIEFHQMVQYLAVPVLEPETSPCQAV
jgi:hypothetical protein